MDKSAEKSEISEKLAEEGHYVAPVDDYSKKLHFNSENGYFPIKHWIGEQDDKELLTLLYFCKKTEALINHSNYSIRYFQLLIFLLHLIQIDQAISE